MPHSVFHSYTEWVVPLKKRTTTISLVKASHSTSNNLLKLGKANTEAAYNFSFSKAEFTFYSSFYLNFSFFKHFIIGMAMVINIHMNLL